jgi:hypothetical protein
MQNMRLINTKLVNLMLNLIHLYRNRFTLLKFMLVSSITYLVYFE